MDNIKYSSSELIEKINKNYILITELHNEKLSSSVIFFKDVDSAIEHVVDIYNELTESYYKGLREKTQNNGVSWLDISTNNNKFGLILNDYPLFCKHYRLEIIINNVDTKYVFDKLVEKKIIVI